LLAFRTPFVAFELVQKFDVPTWEDLWKVVVIDTDGRTLETLKFGLGIRPNNLEIDNLSR
ncbi:hypothetical protein BG011_002630, partial [Mortierella polycephala]